jgi:hypothetical protein
LDQFVSRTPPKQLPQYGLRSKRSCQVTHKQRYQGPSASVKYVRCG